MRIGVIGGSGIYEIQGIAVKERRKVATPFGEPSDSYLICETKGIEVVFLPRHGSTHHIAPHKINFRANIWGFKHLGVERIITVNAVGSIRKKLPPTAIILPNQIIDITENREKTFYDREEIVHIDFTEPYCPELRKTLSSACRKMHIEIKQKATYICTNGPRLETAAEIKAYARLGADIVGMTGMPEASLARELSMCFASIAVVTNYAAGVTAKRLTTREVVEHMEKSTEKIKRILKNTFSVIPEKRACSCNSALKDARMVI